MHAHIKIVKTSRNQGKLTDRKMLTALLIIVKDIICEMTENSET